MGTGHILVQKSLFILVFGPVSMMLSHAAELGDAGGLLEEVYHSDSEAVGGGSKEAVAKDLKEHVEPEGGAAAAKKKGGTGKGEEEPTPVTPAVQGKLV